MFLFLVQEAALPPPVAWSQNVLEKTFLISLSDFDAFESVK